MSEPIFEFAGNNPFGLSSLSNLADIDHDGDLDAFSGNDAGNTLFYRNTGTASNPVFAASQTNPFGLTNVGEKNAFVDIDNDGDLDVFAGDSSGNTRFFKNTGTATNPAFAAPVNNPFGLANVGTYSDPVFVDIDGDGDMDAFVTEYYGGVNFFKNTGTVSNPVFTAQANNFGLNSRGNQPSIGFVDVDSDGDLDAFVGWNDYSMYISLDFYRNTGTAQNPQFQYIKELPFGLSDAYVSTSPLFADIDNDGDQDAFNDSSLYKNVGDGYTPSFSFGGTFDLGDVGWIAVEPFFVDIDGDGDMDAFVGQGDYDVAGKTLFFENTGTVKNPAFAASVTNPFGLTDVGTFASSAFFDIDGDKDMDAFVGDASGNTLFFRNTGTATNPVFSAPQTNPFGLADVGDDATPTFVDIDKDGDLDAFVGNAVGNTLFFRNTGTATNPVFAVPQTNPFGLNGGNPTFVDIDKDGDQDVFTGSNATQFYRNTGTASNPQFVYGGLEPFGLPSSGARTDLTNQTFVDIDGDGDWDAFTTFFFNYTGEPFTAFFINNNAPNTANLTVAEHYTKGTPLNLQNIVASDPDSATITATLKLSNVGAGSLSTDTSGTVTSTYNAANGTWNATGALADVNALLSSVIFIPAANFNGNFTVDASISDGAATALTATKNFTSGAGAFLTSTAANNVLTGTASNNDTVTYVTAASAVTVNLNLTTQQKTGGSGLDTLSKVENLIGSAFNDNLTGNDASNVLVGNAGNDTLAGWSGADTMLGGTGNDTYLIENAGDVVFEKANEGVDTASSRLTYNLTANVENLILTGTAAVNGTGNALNNILTGNNAANQLNGGGGNDTLDGGLGANRFTGGAGNDIFKFTTKGHIDTITDYSVANDTIQLDNAVFTALGPVGTLPAAQFRVGTKALDASDHIIYNSTTGALLYDADGNGATAAQQIATLTAGLAMTSTEFVVI
ncbi:MAG: FG-GAP-like repeat-containing protein [Nitrosomonas sp.]|nr:FG-GAP-like repeat-containing protein [Nitrosomonas sp.]